MFTDDFLFTLLKSPISFKSLIKLLTSPSLALDQMPFLKK